jgi:hypothetical protein
MYLDSRREDKRLQIEWLQALKKKLRGFSPQAKALPELITS